MNKEEILRDERRLFFKRWLRHPLRLGAVLPSSKELTDLIASFTVLNPDGIVIELGGGTGRLTRSLINGGIPPEKLYVFELDPELGAFLQRAYPDVNVVVGNACEIVSLIPKEYIGKVATVVSGMPMNAIPLGIQKQIIKAAFEAMTPDGQFLQYTYSPVSPLPAEKHGLTKKRIGFAVKNVPPASVWRFTKEH